MILWGTVARTEIIDRGDFSCPHCEYPKRYAHVRVASYFSILGMPMYRNGILADFIECQSCRRQFAPEGLELTDIAYALPHHVRAA